MKVLNFLMIGLLTWSCASLDEDQCKRGDWETIGHRDGAKGSPMSVIEKHQEACEEYGVTVDLGKYKIARKEVLKTYCTPENGLDVGVSGKRYYNVCKSKGFLKNYKIGRKIYSIESDITGLENEIDDLQAKMETGNSTEKSYYRS